MAVDESFGGPDGSEAARIEGLICRVSPDQVRSAATFEVPVTALVRDRPGCFQTSPRG